jgi:TetR/AcrR family transcriptional repressor of nem operon
MSGEGNTPDTRARLLAAGCELMLTQGYAATSVDAVCEAAGVTKGAFFHHFASKAAFGEAALGHYWSSTQAMLAAAPFNAVEDPLERVHGYLDLFQALAHDPAVPKSCLFGNLSQEAAPTHSRLQDACGRGFAEWARQIAADLEEAQRRHGAGDFDATGLAEHFIAVYEGSLVLAKAKGDGAVLAQNVEHFRRYLDLLFAKGAEHG